MVKKSTCMSGVLGTLASATVALADVGCLRAREVLRLLPGCASPRAGPSQTGSRPDGLLPGRARVCMAPHIAPRLPPQLSCSGGSVLHKVPGTQCKDSGQHQAIHGVNLQAPLELYALPE